MAPLVGVLALQGDFADHEAALHTHGLRTRQVRSAAQLAGLDGLVLPGGESTTMLKLLDVEGLWRPLGDALRTGLPVFATCAGMILLAEHVENPRQRSYGLLPIAVVRNGYGRQFHSGTFALQSDVLPPGTTGTFIRAPRITSVGPGCEVLARRDGDAVLVRKGPLLAACFHPELQQHHPVCALFAAAVRQRASGSVPRHAGAAIVPPQHEAAS
ncbi:MAG TPA: pyridoxal 5'-phosphate synthase glutaminase subunit PdxT [Planctomycetota bacterium]|nr:pyridoxal 5'-phosphate synthase glutaminase subunit PdxT [Planctomycetota bacterium]